MHQLTIVPNDFEGFRAKPRYIGRLTNWHYEEAHTPAQSASSVQVEIEIQNPLVRTRAARPHYGAAAYRAGKYGG